MKVSSQKRAAGSANANLGGGEHPGSASLPGSSPGEPPVKKARRRHQIATYLTEDEITKLFRAIEKAKDIRTAAMFRLAYHRGLRASELGLLEFDDYDDKKGRLLVRRLKGSRGGEYMLTEAERVAMRRWIKVRGGKPGPLFPSRNHRRISRWRLTMLMKRYCASAGIPRAKAHPHALKHSCGTHLSGRISDVALIQDHLGHANIQNTMIYVQVSSRRRNDLARKLDREGWGR